MMSNNKHDATYGGRYEEPEHDVEYFDPPRVRPGRKKPPLVARVAAGVLMVAVVLGIFAGCVTNYRSGVAYDECIQKIAQTEGHDAAEIAMREGECR
ncbi:hypothetical protein SEA_PERMAG_45 [Microbacterium phage PermaG]|nr:hypothetical protein SEA_PERMAG_45 [Microbacterium phage PermaG]